MTRTLGIVAAQVAPVPYDPPRPGRASSGTCGCWRGLPDSTCTCSPSCTSPRSGAGATASRSATTSASPRRSRAPDRPARRAGALGREVDGPGLDLRARRARRRPQHGPRVRPGGQLVATYRKLFPWMPFETSVPGDRLTVFDIPDVGRFGLMICYDGWLPEVPRNLAWMGAEVILQPTLTKTIDREQELVLARANAITNQAYVVSPNYGALFGTGRSIIVDPEGLVLAQGGSGEEFLTQVIDLDRVRMPCASTARPASTGCGSSCATCRHRPARVPGRLRRRRGHGGPRAARARVGHPGQGWPALTRRSGTIWFIGLEEDGVGFETKPAWPRRSRKTWPTEMSASSPPGCWCTRSARRRRWPRGRILR